jgi:hypothetical protein
MKKDIPLPFGRPAAALKYAPCRVSRLQTANDCFQAGHHIPGKSGMSRFHPPETDEGQSANDANEGMSSNLLLSTNNFGAF